MALFGSVTLLLDLFSIVVVRRGPLEAEKKPLTVAEMRFMRETTGCSLLEDQRNSDIMNDLHMDPIVSYSHQYRANCRTTWKSCLLSEYIDICLMLH